MSDKPASRDVTVLVVDDDDIDVMGIDRAMKSLKIRNPLIRARDGVEGLAMLRDPAIVHKPYVVLLDINLPRMSGLEMLAELRKDEILNPAVVFILTTSKIEEDKLRAYELHVAGYIIKSQVGDGFKRVMEMMDHYWKIVELPT